MSWWMRLQVSGWWKVKQKAESLAGGKGRLYTYSSCITFIRNPVLGEINGMQMKGKWSWRKTIQTMLYASETAQISNVMWKRNQTSDFREWKELFIRTWFSAPSEIFQLFPTASAPDETVPSERLKQLHRCHFCWPEVFLFFSPPGYCRIQRKWLPCSLLNSVFLSHHLESWSFLKLADLFSSLAKLCSRGVDYPYRFQNLESEINQ